MNNQLELDLNPEPEKKCEHEWLYVEDWMGDPEVYNGTIDCSFARCNECGEESYDEDLIREAKNSGY